MLDKAILITVLFFITSGGLTVFEIFESCLLSHDDLTKCVL